MSGRATHFHASGELVGLNELFLGRPPGASSLYCFALFLDCFAFVWHCSAVICRYLPLSAVICPYLPLSALICRYLPLSSAWCWQAMVTRASTCMSCDFMSAIVLLETHRKGTKEHRQKVPITMHSDLITYHADQGSNHEPITKS